MFFFKPKFLIPLALFLAFLATYGVYFYLKQREAELGKMNAEKLPVVAAAKILAFGDSLSADNLEIKYYPPDILPAGSFKTKEEVVGRVLKIDLAIGEPILETKLAPEGSLGGVLTQIPTGMRAMTVPVSVVSGVGGFVLPRTRVDILATIKPPDSSRDPVTRTILQDVLVLAVDQEYRKNDTDPIVVKSVTLLVDPVQAERLTLASTEGKLQLILRNTADSDTTKTTGVKLGQFTGTGSASREEAPAPRRTTRAQARVNPAPAPAPAPAPVIKPAEVKEPDPKTKRVEVIRSNQRSQVEFDESGQTLQDKKR